MTDQSEDRRSKAGAPDICILLNTRSGKRREDARARIEAAMARHPGRFALRVVAKGGNPVAEARRAAEDGFATLVAAGGDGTICAVAGVAHARGLRLGVVPMGTFNYFARGLDLPADPGDAIDLAARGQTRAMAVGSVNGKLFLNNASIGLYPAILATREGTYRRWGRSQMAAHWSVVSTVLRFRRPVRLRVTVDGRTLGRRTPLVFVARSAYQLDHFGLQGAEDVAAGRFGLFLAPDVGRWGLLRFAARLALRSMAQGRDFDYVSGREIEIETKARRRIVARDGEREAMTQPFRFRMSDQPLAVIAPGARS